MYFPEGERRALVLRAVVQGARRAETLTVNLAALKEALSACHQISSGRRTGILIAIAAELAEPGEPSEP